MNRKNLKWNKSTQILSVVEIVIIFFLPRLSLLIYTQPLIFVAQLIFLLKAFKKNEQGKVIGLLILLISGALSYFAIIFIYLIIQYFVTGQTAQW